jgi:hypothetical protein
MRASRRKATPPRDQWLLRSEQPANRAAALALMGDGFANREI